MKKNLSKYSLLLCYALMFFTGFFLYPKWNKTETEATISWDASGYYIYLPAIFIYKDVKKYEFHENVLNKYKPTPNFQQAYLDSNSNNFVLKYSMGQSILMSPFFFIARAYCSYNTNYPDDGFSYPFQFALGIGMFLYALIGLYLMRKILLIYFSDLAVAITLICFVFGSNYLNYSAIDSAMTHNTLFFLYNVLILLTIKYYNKPTNSLAIIIGSIIGLMTLIRPSELVSILIPIFWGIKSIDSFKQRIEFIKSHILSIILFGIFILLVFSIQMIYWKYVTNNWLVYSYQDQGFSWLKPHFYDFMLSYKCGWLVYSPMLIIAILGILTYVKSVQFNLAIVIFLLTFSYVVMSWDVWDYGSNSGRAMVQSYPLFAFCFCSFVEFIWQKKYFKYIFIVVGLLFIYLNIWWTVNSHFGFVQVNNITKEYYWSVVGRWNSNEQIEKYLENEDSYLGEPQEPREILAWDFGNDSVSEHLTLDNKNIKVYELNKNVQASKFFYLDKSLLDKDEKWIRICYDLNSLRNDINFWNYSQIIIKYFNYDKELVKSNMIRVQRFVKDGETRNLFIDSKLPKREDWQTIETFIWNGDGENIIQLYNVKIIAFKE